MTQQNPMGTPANIPPVNVQPPDDHHRPPDDKEVVYYAGSPQLRGEIGRVALFAFIGLILFALPIAWKVLNKEHTFPIWWFTLALFVIGLILMCVPWINARTVRYRISNYRVDYERGLLRKKIDTLELWHVEDIHFEQGIMDRILNVGDITVISNDKTTPKLELQGLPNPRAIFDSLKQRVIAVKRQRGVLKMDMG